MTSFLDQLQAIAGDEQRVGIVVVDHGSRRAQSNALLEDVVRMFQRVTGAPLVEPAHMELAEPSIATAFANCVAQGATLVVVFPYFLSPGRHWNEDIPRLAAQAASNHEGVRHLVTTPLGLHEAMATVMRDRITHCMSHALAGGEACELCDEEGGCASMKDADQVS